MSADREKHCGFCAAPWDGLRCNECGGDLFYYADLIVGPSSSGSARKERATRAVQLVHS